MIARLQDQFVSRLPLFIRKRNEYIYFQLQIEIARDDGLCAGIYCEYKKIRTDRSLEEIGKIAKDMLIRFHELSDLSADEFKALTGFNDIESYDIDSKGNVKNIRIEVKTTSSRVDTEFFVSKNEVETSIELKKK